MSSKTIIDVQAQLKKGKEQVEEIRATRPDYTAYCSHEINNHMQTIMSSIELADNTSSLFDISRHLQVAMGRLKLLNAFHQTLFASMSQEQIDDFFKRWSEDLRQEEIEHSKGVDNAH
jgi:two-component sensor histidine kinase